MRRPEVRPALAREPLGFTAPPGLDLGVGAAASTARASTSARITMPGPPPAGVSSTERCLSLACARISTASRLQRLAASALPARLKPSGPGNISGKMVRTVARHMLLNPARAANSVLPSPLWGGSPAEAQQRRGGRGGGGGGGGAGGRRAPPPPPPP